MLFSLSSTSNLCLQDTFPDGGVVSLCFLAITTGVIVYYRGLPSQKEEVLKPLVCSPASTIQTILQFGGRFKHQFLLDQARKVGKHSYRISLPLSRKGTYVIGDGSLAREILVDPSTDKALALFRGTEKIFCRPTMISVSSRSTHLRFLRKGTSYAFSQREVRRMNHIAEQQAHKMLERIVQKGCEPFDPAFETKRLTFMVVCEAAFEYSSATDKEYQEFNYNCEIVFRELVTTQEANPIYKYFGALIPRVREAYKCRDILHSFVRKLLDQYRKNPNPSEANTLIKLIEQNKFLEGDEDQKIAELFLWAFAGFDTTGLTLSNALILLAKHPHIQDKLRDAIEHSEEPHKSAYFQHFVKESIRYTSALGSFRQVGIDHEHGDFKVPKGAVCLISPYVACHNRNVFSDPSSFRPERWEEPTPEMLEHYYPFSLGTRKCPGQSLAMSEIDLALPLLIKRFSFSVAQEGTLECGSTLSFNDYRLVAKVVDK